jgi:hypothetical protein
MVQSLLPVIYGNAWISHEHEVRKYNNFTSESKREVVYVYPRYSSISYFLTIFTSIIFTSMPHTNILIVDDSLLLRSKISHMLSAYFEFTRVKETRNLIAARGKSINVYSPLEMKNLVRGIGFNILLLHCDEIHRETICLISEKKGHKFVFLTQKKYGEVLTRMLNFSVFHKVEESFMCNECLELEESGGICQHYEDNHTPVPEWVDSILNIQRLSYS